MTHIMEAMRDPHPPYGWPDRILILSVASLVFVLIATGMVGRI